jgi:hypothetical protein
MPLTLRQAAEETGKTKQAIQQAIKSGKISAKKNDFNEWEIDPAELFRIYQPVKRLDVGNNQELGGDWHKELKNLSPDLQTRIIKLTVNVDVKDKEIALLEKRASELETERDDWKEQAQRLALTYQKPVESDKAVSVPTLPENRFRLSGGQIFVIVMGILITFTVAVFLPEIRARLAGYTSPPAASAGIQQPTVTLQPKE